MFLSTPKKVRFLNKTNELLFGQRCVNLYQRWLLFFMDINISNKSKKFYTVLYELR